MAARKIPIWGSVAQGLIDLIYPKACVVCRNKLVPASASIDNLICNACWNKIKINVPPFCRSCGRALKRNNLAKNICAACIKQTLYFDRAFSPCVYEGVIKELIHEFKYRNKDYLGAPLSKLMINFIKEYALPINYLDTVIPVPLHQAKLREREFNQAQILAGQIAKEFNKCLIDNALIKNRLTKSQTELAGQERFFNVLSSFTLKSKTEVSGKNILLVDDVLTTGATASEAAYTLKTSGAKMVFVLTLAN